MDNYGTIMAVPALRGLLYRITEKHYYLHAVDARMGKSQTGDDVVADNLHQVDLDPASLLTMGNDVDSIAGQLAQLPDLIHLGNVGSFLIAHSKQTLASLCGHTNASASQDVWQRLSGKIAIVTGSAQGFGEGIARELAKVGASVVIADLNGERAEEVAADLNRDYGVFTALAIKVNVADEASVQAMIETTVSYFGGLDLYVNNAGVLKAGSLEEMTLDAFKFVTDVNYTAYYLGTKHAARPMRLQNKAAGSGWTDIVQINSKSGLEGSNKNFAYAGGKFGGIGLTQSFAKELVVDHIKVNAICPGNFYEGPLWSDPERGLFVQYLNTGKVLGAKTIDDVYQHYVKQVPMRKGCSPLDVARAIFYVAEQENETGQALPVTGGQVMLS